MRSSPMRRNVLAIGALAAFLLVLSLGLTIAGSAHVGSVEFTRGQIWASEREAFMKRPTLDEMNQQIGRDATPATEDGGPAYVWYDVALPEVVITGRFADDGRLSYFRRVSNPRWRT